MSVQPSLAGAVFLKIYRLPGWKFWMRPSKPVLEAFNLRLLERWGVPAVRVLATGSRRAWWGLVDAFLMTEEWSGGQMLSNHAMHNWPIRGSGPLPFRDFRVARSGPIGPAEREDQRQIGSRLAEAVRAMHRRHFYHIDLQWRNVLVRRDGTGRWEICLLDCPRGGWRMTPVGRMHGQVRDLASLDRLAGVYLSRAERLRWFLEYCGLDRLDEKARRLARRVMRYRDRFERYRGQRTAPRNDGRGQRLELGDRR